MVPLGALCAADGAIPTFDPEALPEHPSAQLASFGTPLVDRLLDDAVKRGRGGQFYLVGQNLQPHDLLNRLRATRHGAAPPTIYRALEFLLERGLIHKLESISSFVGCVSHGDTDHAAQFLICRTCGQVTELDDHELAHALDDAAKRLGFTVGKATIEAEGRCASCARG